MTDTLLQRLPQRPPFLLLDRVLLLEPGAWAAAVKRIEPADPFLAGDGSWPAALLIEVMAQTAGLAASPPGTGGAVIAGIDRCVCRGEVQTGDELLAVARVRRAFGAAVRVHTALRRGRRRWAAAEIVLRFG